MRGRRSERRTGRCPYEPATPTPLRNDEGNLCRESVGRSTTGVAAWGRATAGELSRGDGRRGESTRTGGVATLESWVPVMAWD